MDNQALPHSEAIIPYDLKEQEKVFGYTQEDMDKVILPMARDGHHAIDSMGVDVPLAVLNDRPQLLYDYFKENFAQVTNPPIDPLREELVMSLTEYIGAVGMNILTPSESHCKWYA